MYRILAAGLAAAMIVLLAAPMLPAAASQTTTSVVVRSGVAGEVLPLHLAVAGQAVRLGNALLYVRNAYGRPVVAARATATGRIVQMYIDVGDSVHVGDPVAEIRVR
jgi:multidrug efflux pump subunit AcrA (membrane-fusion protein)